MRHDVSPSLHAPRTLPGEQVECIERTRRAASASHAAPISGARLQAVLGRSSYGHAGAALRRAPVSREFATSWAVRLAVFASTNNTVDMSPTRGAGRPCPQNPRRCRWFWSPGDGAGSNVKQCRGQTERHRRHLKDGEQHEHAERDTHRHIGSPAKAAGKPGELPLQVKRSRRIRVCRGGAQIRKPEDYYSPLPRVQLRARSPLVVAHRAAQGWLGSEQRRRHVATVQKPDPS